MKYILKALGSVMAGVGVSIGGKAFIESFVMSSDPLDKIIGGFGLFAGGMVLWIAASIMHEAGRK
jgi:energy-converting hydrogenase Eha subunit C